MSALNETKMNTETEMITEIINTQPAKKRVIKKPKVAENKKVIIQEDNAEETAGKKLEVTNPVIVETEVTDLFALAKKEYEENPENHLEEHLDQQDQLAELLSDRVEDEIASAEDDKLAEMLRQKAQLELNIQNYEASKMVRRKATEYRTLLMKNRREKTEYINKKMEELAEELQKVKEETEAIQGLDDEELTSTIMSDEKLREECGFIPNRPMPTEKRPSDKVVKKAPPTKTNSGQKKTLTKIDRKLSHSLIPTNAVLIAKTGDKVFYIRKNSKGTFSEVTNIEDPKKHNGNIKMFQDLTAAAKYFMEDICGKSGGNAWAIYKAYNKISKKGESIEGINSSNLYDCVDVEKYLA